MTSQLPTPNDSRTIGSAKTEIENIPTLTFTGYAGMGLDSVFGMFRVVVIRRRRRRRIWPWRALLFNQVIRRSVVEPELDRNDRSTVIKTARYHYDDLVQTEIWFANGMAAQDE